MHIAILISMSQLPFIPQKRGGKGLLIEIMKHAEVTREELLDLL